jgi:hypothetical protein
MTKHTEDLLVPNGLPRRRCPVPSSTNDKSKQLSSRVHSDSGQPNQRRVLSFVRVSFQRISPAHKILNSVSSCQPWPGSQKNMDILEKQWHALTDSCAQ